MRSTICLVLVLSFVATASGVSFAGGGGAYIPHYNMDKASNVYSYPTLWVSNISGEDITVDVYLYHRNAGLVTDQGHLTNVAHQASTTANGAIISFELSPNETGLFTLTNMYTDETLDGYGVLKWQTVDSDSKIPVGVTAYIENSTNTTYGKGLAGVPINMGMPF